MVVTTLCIEVDREMTASYTILTLNFYIMLHINTYIAILLLTLIWMSLAVMDAVLKVTKRQLVNSSSITEGSMSLYIVQ